MVGSKHINQEEISSTYFYNWHKITNENIPFLSKFDQDIDCFQKLQQIRTKPLLSFCNKELKLLILTEEKKKSEPPNTGTNHPQNMCLP
jgi:hypothetical protein